MTTSITIQPRPKRLPAQASPYVAGVRRLRSLSTGRVWLLPEAREGDWRSFRAAGFSVDEGAKALNLDEAKGKRK